MIVFIYLRERVYKLWREAVGEGEADFLLRSEPNAGARFRGWTPEP